MWACVGHLYAGRVERRLRPDEAVGFLLSCLALFLSFPRQPHADCVTCGLCSWGQETDALLGVTRRDVLTFDDFLHCTVAYPPIAIGICLLREADIKEMPQGDAEGVEQGLLAVKLRQQKAPDPEPQHLSQVGVLTRHLNPVFSRLSARLSTQFLTLSPLSLVLLL